MSRMSEQHDDLSTIHAILLGQRKVAIEESFKAERAGKLTKHVQELIDRANTITDLLLEIEAAGVVWPDNVVSLDLQPQRHTPCDCNAYKKHGFCNCIDW